MINKTNEFSFILKPAQYGVGVFAVEDIKKDTHLRLFGDKETIDLRSLVRNKKDVPKIFWDYCMDRGEDLVCPIDFGHMHLGWYLNHSKNPNTYPDKDYKWYAKDDIKAGEEITIDYNLLNEPKENQPDYY